MSTSEKIRVGIVGAGSTTTKHYIPRWLRMDDVEVVSVANRTRRSSERVAKQFGIPKVYDQWTDLVAASDTDVIYVGTWPYLHEAATIAALYAGKHVLTQARMAMNAAEAHNMMDASRRHADLVAQIVPTIKASQGMDVISDLLADGLIGEILSVDVTTGDFLSPDAPFWWRLDQDVSGVNTMDVGQWAELLARFLGPFTSVTALARVHRPWRRDGEGNRRIVTVPDHVEIIAETASGPIVHLRHSQVMLQSDLGAWFFGNEGTLKIVAGVRKFYVARRGDKVFREIEIPSEHSREIEADVTFFDSIRNGTPVTHTTFGAGVRYMEFTEAVLRSAQTCETVFLPLTR